VRKSPPGSARSVAAAALLGASIGALLTCDAPESPTAAGAVTRSAARTAAATTPRLDATGALAQEASSDVTAQGTIPLPINQSVATGVGTSVFRITQTGGGANAYFANSSTTNTSPALYAVTAGNGTVAFFQSVNASATRTALVVQAAGRGRAGDFSVTNSTNGSAALYVSSAGTGPAIHARATGASLASGQALYASHGGTGAEAAKIAITNTSNTRAALFASTVSTGPAAVFHGTSFGVQIVTNSGGKGLQVVNGTKQAVVSTPSGARSLYSEEATEVWFADYGFARLADGAVRVALDSTFVQTVSVEEPYHVFVQSYGDAELIVRERTPAGFVVMLRAGDERDAEFSYRVVAKRHGFERTRLEPAPWAGAARAPTPRDR
jgi:hypothetical protein